MEVAPLYTPFKLFTLSTLFILFKLLYTAVKKQNHVCLYLLLGKFRARLKWAGELLSKKLGDGWMDWSG